MICLTNRGQVATKQVAFLVVDRTYWLVIDLASVRFIRLGFGKQETVIGGDNDIVAIQAVDDESNHITKLVDRLANGIKRVAFGCLLFATAVDFIVVDVNNLLASYGITPFFFFHFQQVIGPQNNTIDQ